MAMKTQAQLPPLVRLRGLRLTALAPAEKGVYGVARDFSKKDGPGAGARRSRAGLVPEAHAAGKVWLARAALMRRFSNAPARSFTQRRTHSQIAQRPPLARAW